MKKHGVALLVAMLCSPQIFACLPDVKKSLDTSMEYAKKTEIKGNSFDETWYSSINKNEDLIPDIIIAYGQAGCWLDAINIAKSIQNIQSEQQNKKYAYALSNLAILKAFTGDYDEAKAMLNELKYKSQASNNNYGTLIVAEIMTKQRMLDTALELIKANRYIDKTSYTSIIENLLSTGQFDLAKAESKNTFNTEILFPYIKYLSEKNAKDEAYLILSKIYNEITDKELYFWKTRDISISYAMFDDFDKIQEISDKFSISDKILEFSYAMPFTKSEQVRNKLKESIFKNYENLAQEKKLRYINELAENYALTGDIDEFVKLINHTTKKPIVEYEIQLAAISFVKIQIYKNNLPLAKKSLLTLSQYIKPESNNDYYSVQSLIFIEDGNFDKANDIAQKLSFISSDLVIYAASKEIEFKSLGRWYTESTNNKACIAADCLQAVSARIALLDINFDPIKMFKTENPYTLARSWFGYGQGKMRIKPGIENVLHILLPTEHNNSDVLLYQLYKSN